MLVALIAFISIMVFLLGMFVGQLRRDELSKGQQKNIDTLRSDLLDSEHEVGQYESALRSIANGSPDPTTEASLALNIVESRRLKELN